ncbi:MAG: hypothetical protein JSV56_03750, partial [Methanomassiliicoccales archaeon]
IQVGDWVAAESRSGRIFGTGKYDSLVDGFLILREPPKRGESTNRVPAAKTALLYHGEAYRIPYHTKRGLVNGVKLGGTTGAIIGGAVGGVLGFFGYSMYWGRTDAEGEEPMSQGKYIAYIMAQGALAGGLPCGLIGALFGTLGGIITSQDKHDKAKRYRIGPGQWEIVVE